MINPTGTSCWREDATPLFIPAQKRTPLHPSALRRIVRMFYFRVKTIPLTRGKVALVDDEDFEMLSRFKWQALRVRRKFSDSWYARRMTSMKDGPRKAVYMHHEVLGKKCLADHKNGNGLDNRKENVRECTYSENSWNRRKTKKATYSKYRGVTWNKANKKWLASIKNDGTSYYLSYCDNEVDAAIYYNVAAQLFFGEYAMLNCIEE